MCTRFTLLAAVFLGVAGSAMAQGSVSPPPNDTPAASTGLSRAEVLADLELWHRAGMTYWPHPPAEMDMQYTAEYQAGLARYRQLRGGQAMQQTAARYPDMPGK